jgi:hypothetical protein
MTTEDRMTLRRLTELMEARRRALPDLLECSSLLSKIVRPSTPTEETVDVDRNRDR